MSGNLTMMPVLGISTWMIVSIVVIVVLIAALVALSIYGKKLEKRQNESQQQLESAAQSVSLLIIDKKRMKLKDSGLPAIVLEQTPKYMRGRKVPIVKAKVGPRIMSLICDEKIYDQIPLKKEVKATVSGIYIMGVKGLHTKLEKPQGKEKFGMRLRRKADSMREEIETDKKKREKELNKKTKKK